MKIKPDQTTHTDKPNVTTEPSDLADAPTRPLSDDGVTGLDDNDQSGEGGKTFEKLPS